MGGGGEQRGAHGAHVRSGFVGRNQAEATGDGARHRAEAVLAEGGVAWMCQWVVGLLALHGSEGIDIHIHMAGLAPA